MTDAQSPNSTATPSRLSFALIFFSSAATALITCAGFYFFLRWRGVDAVLSRNDCVSVNDTQICFFENTLQAQEMLSVLTSFYTNVIVILIAILTIVTALAALSIRYSAKQHVEAELPHLTDTFFAHGVGNKKIEDLIATRASAIDGRVDEFQREQEKYGQLISGLVKKIEDLEYMSEFIDTGESVAIPEDDGKEGAPE